MQRKLKNLNLEGDIQQLKSDKLALQFSDDEDEKYLLVRVPRKTADHFKKGELKFNDQLEPSVRHAPAKASVGKAAKEVGMVDDLLEAPSNLGPAKKEQTEDNFYLINYQERLGKGTFGSVYKAYPVKEDYTLDLDHPAVAKILNPKEYINPAEIIEGALIETDILTKYYQTEPALYIQASDIINPSAKAKVQGPEQNSLKELGFSEIDLNNHAEIKEKENEDFAIILTEFIPGIDLLKAFIAKPEKTESPVKEDKEQAELFKNMDLFAQGLKENPPVKPKLEKEKPVNESKIEQKEQPQNHSDRNTLKTRIKEERERTKNNPKDIRVADLNFVERMALLDEMAQAFFMFHQDTQRTGSALFLRDIKPANVKIEIIEDPVTHKKAFYFYPLDFGLTEKVVNDKKKALKSNGGTLPYMAPEVYLEKSGGVKSDIWSMAALVISILGGKDPIKDKPDLLEEEEGQVAYEAYLAYSKIPFNLEGMFKIEIPEHYKKLIEYIKRFLDRMQDYKYDARPSSEEVLEFFHSVNQYCLVTEAINPVTKEIFGIEELKERISKKKPKINDITDLEKYEQELKELSDNLSEKQDLYELKFQTLAKGNWYKEISKEAKTTYSTSYFNKVLEKENELKNLEPAIATSKIEFITQLTPQNLLRSIQFLFDFPLKEISDKYEQQDIKSKLDQHIFDLHESLATEGHKATAEKLFNYYLKYLKEDPKATLTYFFAHALAQCLAIKIPANDIYAAHTLLMRQVIYQSSELQATLQAYSTHSNHPQLFRSSHQNKTDAFATNAILKLTNGERLSDFNDAENALNFIKKNPIANAEAKVHLIHAIQQVLIKPKIIGHPQSEAMLKATTEISKLIDDTYLFTHLSEISNHQLLLLLKTLEITKKIAQSADRKLDEIKALDKNIQKLKKIAVLKPFISHLNIFNAREHERNRQKILDQLDKKINAFFPNLNPLKKSYDTKRAALQTLRELVEKAENTSFESIYKNQWYVDKVKITMHSHRQRFFPKSADTKEKTETEEFLEDLLQKYGNIPLGKK